MFTFELHYMTFDF